MRGYSNLDKMVAILNLSLPQLMNFINNMLEKQYSERRVVLIKEIYKLKKQSQMEEYILLNHLDLPPADESKKLLVQSIIEAGLSNDISIVEGIVYFNKKDDESSSEIFSNPDLITLENLENILINIIYDYVLKNPKYVDKDHRNVPPQRKKTVKKRDGYRCQICGEKFTDDQLEIDHILPRSFGGSNEEINLMTLCTRCNRDKNSSLKYYRDSDGREKILLNIGEFVRTLPIITDFNSWLEKMGDKRRRRTK